MKVLVVDDAAEVIEAVTVSFTLQWRETEVIGADNGETALDLIEQEKPDVVLLDIAMPGMDGFETLREIRRCCAGSTCRSRSAGRRRFAPAISRSISPRGRSAGRASWCR